ncbi:hypothetical protein NPIL_581941 [Nephila pilipes]|uniref:Uncharacterized protein n=1 Tax=Nephila pilipes TaxID=299642 RepID=A0A8X6NJR8_NEPPI|nr:hypothetical protein NPIL_581941 [Nephila pilipes]
MDGTDTPGILNIPTAQSLLVSDLESEEAWKLATFANNYFFPEQNGGKPKRLPASRALFVPVADSDPNVSISAATHAERVSLKLGHPDLTQSNFLRFLKKLYEASHC